MKPKIEDAVKGTEEKIWIYEMGQIIHCPDGYEFHDENGNVINAKKIVLEKKKPKYPKSYKECCEVLGLDTMENDASGYKHELIIRFQELLIARDAYWKIAGEEMGLGKPWEHDFANTLLVFPTEEMRHAFYENFKELIEELL